jgi:hypothetical protein
MMDLETEVDEGHGGCVCPLCDNAVMKWEPHEVVVAHGCKYIVHKDCVVQLDRETEDEEDDG